MAKADVRHDRAVAAIIDSAAAVLAARGKAVSMEEIASSAGIGRATLYRYFPNRETLLQAMAVASVAELAARVRDADLDAVTFDEGIARLARGFIATGSKYIALSDGSAGRTDAYPNADVEVIEPIRELLRRGIAEGAVRPDIAPDLLLDLFSGLIKGALDATSRRRRGIEETAAAVTTVFLRGARASQQL